MRELYTKGRERRAYTCTRKSSSIDYYTEWRDDALEDALAKRTSHPWSTCLSRQYGDDLEKLHVRRSIKGSLRIEFNQQIDEIRKTVRLSTFDTCLS